MEETTTQTPSPENGYLMSWDDQNGIGRVVVFGITDAGIAKNIVSAAVTLQQQKNTAQAKWLIDVSKNTKATPDSRKIFNDFVNREDVQKLAFVGVQPLVKAMMNFLFFAQLNKKLKFFVTEQEALQWLHT